MTNKRIVNAYLTSFNNRRLPVIAITRNAYRETKQTHYYFGVTPASTARLARHISFTNTHTVNVYADGWQAVPNTII